MNFDKWLRLLLEQTLPEWRAHYISYKLLKKQIKLIAAAKNSNIQNISWDEDCWNEGDIAGGISMEGLDAYEVRFIRLLNAELHKLNKFMEEKIKDYHIRLQVLKDKIQQKNNAREDSEEVIKLGKALVNFHGELVLLENYSVWNYTGLRKILKKYDRQIRAVLGKRYINWVKRQPCFATESLLKLISECQSIFQSSHLFVDQDHKMEIFGMDEENEQIVYKSSIAALEILNEMMTIASAYDDDS